MVDAGGSSLLRRTYSPSWLAWSGVGSQQALSLHSSNELGELSQLLNVYKIKRQCKRIWQQWRNSIVRNQQTTKALSQRETGDFNKKDFLQPRYGIFRYYTFRLATMTLSPFIFEILTMQFFQAQGRFSRFWWLYVHVEQWVRLPAWGFLLALKCSAFLRLGH